MIVSIGVLAHNEERTIGKLLGDLLSQTLFQRSGVSVELHVVANGCSDATARVASEVLAPLRNNGQSHKYTVHDLETPGKANAWNQLVHFFADGRTEYIFLIDADIRIYDGNLLESTLTCLEDSPAAAAATDEPVKDIQLRSARGPLETIISAFSRTSHDIRDAICGQFYCAKFSWLRQVWMPNGIIGEDGFLHAMTVTGKFSSNPNAGRVVHVPGGRHYFETRTQIPDILHHQLRLAIGTGMNVLLFDHLTAKAKDGVDLTNYIAERNAADPKWLNTLVRDHLAANNKFAMHRSFIWRRLDHFRTLPLRRKIVKCPVYAAGWLLDLYMFLAADRALRRGSAYGFW